MNSISSIDTMLTDSTEQSRTNPHIRDLTGGATSAASTPDGDITSQPATPSVANSAQTELNQARGARQARAFDFARYSTLPTKDLLKIRMNELDIKNVDLQRTLGYPKANVIAMMKCGAMQLPANKVIDAARLLEVDPVFLLGKVVAEKDPDLWRAILTLLGKELVTDNEMDLIQLVRRELGGHDVDLVSSAAFVDALIPLLKSAFDQASALAQAALERAAR